MKTRAIKKSKQQGFAALLFTFVVLVAVSITSIISSNQLTTRQSSVISSAHLNNAFNTAQAGLDYAVPYLDENYDTITDNQNVSLSLNNGDRVNLLIEFISGKDELRVTSTGYAQNEEVQYQVSQIYHRLSTDSHTSSPSAIKARGGLDMSNGAELHDHENGLYTAQLGDGATLRNPAETYILGDRSPSSSGRTGKSTDIVEYDSGVSTLSDDNLTLATLGLERSVYQAVATDGYASEVNVSYTRGRRGAYEVSYGDYNYLGDLNGHSGSGLEIHQSAGNATISNGSVGSEGDTRNAVIHLEPGTGAIIESASMYGDVVVYGGDLQLQNNTEIHGNLVVEGNVTINNRVDVHGAIIATGNITMAQNSKVYGVLFALGNIELNNNVEVNGAVISGETVTMSNSAEVHYYANYAAISYPEGYSGNSGYAKVAGSWTDLAST